MMSVPRFRFGLAAAPLILSIALAGCVSENNGPTGSTEAPPAQATYDCGDGERLSIRRSAGFLVAENSLEGSAQLEASPPGQTSRYGADGFALVLEGAEALWMKAGREPMVCRQV